MRYFKIYRLALPIAVIILFQNCQTKKDNWVLIAVTSDPVQMVYLYQLNTLMEKSLIDSTQEENGKFTIEHSNTDDQLAAFVIDFDKDEKGGVEIIIANGDHLKVNVNDEFDSEFSGTPITQDDNKYNVFRHEAMNHFTELQKLLSQPDLNTDELNDRMLVLKEKMQDLENEKIGFLKSIQNPGLNSYRVLNEVVSTGIIEKELFGKYVGALTPEGAMTNNGHKIHQINAVFDAYALSREVDIFDTATICERYAKLDDGGKTSPYAEKALKYLL